MIARLQGIVTDQEESSVVLDVHGVGFRVLVTPATNHQLVLGQEATLVTHLHVREDAMEVFGFLLNSERSMFDLLLKVSGVGPKLALSLLGALSIETLQQAIETGNAATLRGVSGVGSKTAERIIVDLRGKLVTLASDGASDDVADALVRLGYSSKEAREAARQVPPKESPENRLKAALRALGK